MDTDSPARRLRVWNAALAVLHAAQGALVLVLANDFALPVTIGFLQGPPGSELASETLFELPIGPAVAAFLFLAALDHAIVAAPGGAAWYERNLRRERNPARWYEYAFSASLMVVLIAMLTGIADVAALIALFGVNAAMILFGLAMEEANEPGRPVTWRPFVYGSIVGAIPWLAIGLQLGYSEAETGDVPTFVYAIFFSLFVLFFSFAVNMALQYGRVGP
ncbi:MAG TPA: heliorhodopsin HeR, partial [Gaiellaceae bacterium]|nr:heliorhodopsin HeR [Gaiellaceae bacterium]